MNYLELPIPINKIKSENIIRSKIKVKEFNDWETSSDEQAAKSEKIEVDYPKVDADTVEDKLLNLQRAVEHLRKARLLKAGMKTQLDRIEQFHSGETEQAFRAWKHASWRAQTTSRCPRKKLYNWMVSFVIENARREQLTYMQRHLINPFELTPSKFLQRIRIMTAQLNFLPTTERKLNVSKDEVKYIYIYAMPNTFLKKAHEVNFNLNTESLSEINSYFESLDRASKKRKAIDDAKKAKRNKSETRSGWKRGESSVSRTARNSGKHGGDEKERGCSLCVAEGRHRQAKTHTLANCHYKAKKAESNAICEDESDEEFHHSKVSKTMKNVSLHIFLSPNTHIKSTYGSDTPRFTTMVAVVFK